MAKKRISYRRKKRNRKDDNIEGIPTTHVPLCAMGEVIKEKKLFSPIHHLVKIDQKSVEYTPTDKLVFATLSITAGGETVYDINTTLRPNKPLLVAFGYEKCADQSVIQQTINSATEENVNQLEEAIKKMFKENNNITLFLDENQLEQDSLKISIFHPFLHQKPRKAQRKDMLPKRKINIPVNWRGLWFLLPLRLSANLFILAIQFLALF